MSKALIQLQEALTRLSASATAITVTMPVTEDSTPRVRSWNIDLASMDAATTIIGLLSVAVMLLDGVDQTEAPPTGVHQPNTEILSKTSIICVCHAQSVILHGPKKNTFAKTGA